MNSPNETGSDLHFHNAHLEPRPDGSWHIGRFPRETLNQLNPHAHWAGIDSCGAEIRFHTNAPGVHVILSCENSEGSVQIYRGPYLQKTLTLPRGVPTLIDLATPESLQEAQSETLESGGYSTKLWRIAFGRGSYRFHSFDGFGHKIRRPTKEELPKVNWLAYGSSITHSNLAGHPFHASRLLHWNLWVKGLAGSCHIEPSTADYLADEVKRSAIDIVTAELGVNMKNWFTLEAFKERVNYFVKTLRSAMGAKPIVLITSFSNIDHHAVNRETKKYQNQIRFDQHLRDLQQTLKDPNLHLIKGTELLPDFTLLSSDLLHPSDSGQALMGQILAHELKKLIT